MIKFLRYISTNYRKYEETWLPITNQTRVAAFKANPRYSPRTRRFLPDDLALPEVQIPEYTSPCDGGKQPDCFDLYSKGNN